MSNLDVKNDFYSYNCNRNGLYHQQASIKSNKNSLKQQSQNNENLLYYSNNHEMSRHSNRDETFKYKTSFKNSNRNSLIENTSRPIQNVIENSTNYCNVPTTNSIIFWLTLIMPTDPKLFKITF